MSVLVPIGKRIQKLREKRDLTQEQLEELTGINSKYISAVESGQKNVTVKTLEKIAKGLNIELYELFLISEEPASAKMIKTAIVSLLNDADLKSLSLCLDFLRKC